MERNKKGVLFSTEISSNVGRLAPQRLKKRRRFIVSTPSTVLSTALKQSGRLDIFMHDSDHSYNGMRYEFELVKNRMRHNGVILSDDIQSNSAFMELAGELGKKPRIIAGIAKSFGIIEL